MTESNNSGFSTESPIPSILLFIQSPNLPATFLFPCYPASCPFPASTPPNFLFVLRSSRFHVKL